MVKLIYFLLCIYIFLQNRLLSEIYGCFGTFGSHCSIIPEHAINGDVSWKFVLDNPDKVIDTIDVKFNHQTYENGKIEVELESENSKMLILCK